MGLCHAPVCGRHRTRGIVRPFSSDSCLACPDMPSIVEGNLSAHGLNNGSSLRSSFHSWGELQCSEPEPLVSSMPTLDTCYQQRVKGGLVFSNMPWLCYATLTPPPPPPPPPPRKMLALDYLKISKPPCLFHVNLLASGYKCYLPTKH